MAMVVYIMALSEELKNLYRDLKIKKIDENCPVLKAVLIEISRLTMKSQSFFGINCDEKVDRIKQALIRLDNGLSAGKKHNISMALYTMDTDDILGSLSSALASQRISMIGESTSSKNVTKAFNIDIN
jgi:hypothetical protein